jgi:uncharacterized protein DUF998
MSRTDVYRPTPDVSTPTRRSPRSDGLLALAGAGTFAALVILLHFVEKDFDPGRRFISEYVLGDSGLLMNLAFIALGGGLMALAHGLRGSLSPGRRVTASVRLIYVGGIATVLSGFFNSDPISEMEAGRASWHESLHDLAGVIGFVCLIVATVFLRGVFARDAQWRRFAPHAVLFAIAIAVMFGMTIFAPVDVVGVVQRVFVTVALLWIATLACGLLTAEPALPIQQRDPAPRQ